ncbi:MAG: hypothetical protein JSS51_10305 [Planctomycetes bacterium]|nr:hypothetical protein [Planctomycetota bacterium]
MVSVVAGGAFAQSTAVIPLNAVSLAGDNGNAIPLGDYLTGTFQTMYDADQLAAIPVGSTITGIRLRLYNGASTNFPEVARTLPQYDIRLAQAATATSGMSNTFASNMINPVLVRSGSFNIAAGAYPGGAATGTTPEGWGPLIPFTTPYLYVGGGLTVEFRAQMPGAAILFFADSVRQPNKTAYLSAGSSTATTGGGVQQWNGLAMQLTFTPPIPDLAKGVTKVIVAERVRTTSDGFGNGVLTWTSGYTQQAVAGASQLDTIGPGSDFVGLSWRLWKDAAAAWPAAIANFSSYDIQLSRSLNPPGSLSPTVASNAGPDAVTVRSGALSFGIGAFQSRGSEAVSPFGPEVGFATPYQYREGALLSVFRHSGQASGSPGFLDAIDSDSDIDAMQAPTASTATTPSGSSVLTTRYSVDAGTISPLSQLAPANGYLGDNVPNVLQTVLSASELRYIPVGSVIDSLWFRMRSSGASGPAAPISATDFELSLSSATAQPSGMNATFANNEGADKILVYDGGLVIPANVFPAGSSGNFGKMVQFQKSFVYKGGPLCVTIRHKGMSAGLENLEAVFGSGATNRTTYSYTIGAGSGTFFASGYTGMAMKLGYIPSVMTPNSLATTEGSSAWNLPFMTNYAVQTIIPASQLRTVTVGSAITGMSLRSDGFSSGPFPTADTTLPRFDVSLAPAARAPLSISATFANNIGPGGVQVRSGPMTVPANAYPNGLPAENAWYVPFSRAYVYEGGDLCVTIRGQGALGASIVFFDGESADALSTGASIYDYSSADAASGSRWGPLAIRLAFTPRAFCPWDLNNDGVVDDGDFPTFLNAYNILDCTDGSMPLGCPADFNFDRVVDDADFVIFLGAYNTLLCP